ncbi:MAG: EscS/YscS/HrcS family type III secretion system export apparatus protein [Candidatus Dadabacteria bacterium]|nr:MAG: EscS/YscS/HrcS family type III secretion system export apparatus protein [Candidatus Dadabacteria bacterium]
MIDIYLKETLTMTIAGTFILLGASSLAGLFVAILQTATQIQEQSFPFLIKFSVFALTLIIFGKWLLAYALSFMQEMLSSLVQLGAM